MSDAVIETLIWRRQREETPCLPLDLCLPLDPGGLATSSALLQGSGAALDVLAALWSPFPSPGALSLGLGGGETWKGQGAEGGGQPPSHPAASKG